MAKLLNTGGLILFLSLGIAASALANVTAELDPEQVDFDAAFETMLQNPTDVETILRYSRAATAAGDYESAIGALERLLLMNANQPVVRADLGLLYYRLESYAVSRHHLVQVEPDLDRLPTALRKSVKRTLQRLEKRATRHRVDGVLSLGLRYQSNANAGPESNRILSGGAPVILSSGFGEQEDVNAGAYARVRYRYDLRTRNQAEIDTVATFLATRYDDIDRLDTTMLEIAPGIRFKPSPANHKGLTLRPHLLGRIYERDGDKYSDSWGVGIDTRYRVREDLTFSGKAQYRSRDYSTSSTRPILDQNDGHEKFLSVSVHKGLWRGTRLLVRASGLMRETKRDFRDANAYGVLGRLTTAYDPLFTIGENTDPWLAHFGLGYRYLKYDDPDPVIDPGETRRDNKWLASIATTIPVSEDWEMKLGLTHTKIDSNIRNFDRNNTAVDLKAVMHF